MGYNMKSLIHATEVCLSYFFVDSFVSVIENVLYQWGLSNTDGSVSELAAMCMACLQDNTCLHFISL